MTNDKLRYLKRLVDKLSANEKAVLQDYLSSFDTRGKNYQPKTLSLLHLLMENEDLKAILQKMPKALDTKSESAMRMVAHRLKEKIGESLLLDINVNRDGSYEDIFKAKVDVCKKKQVSEIYRSRGLDAEKEQLYGKIISVSKKYELYPELIEALLLKQEHISLTKGRKQFEAIEEDLAEAEKCRVAAINAKKAYYRTIQQYAFEGHNRNTPSEEYLSELEQEITRLKNDFQSTGSANVGYYLYMLQIEYYQVQKNHKKASEFCLHTVEIVRNTPAIYHKRRLGLSYLNLCQNEIFNHYFDYARGFVVEAKKCFIQGSANYNLALELEFYAYFYDEKLDLAEQALEHLIYDPELEQSEFRLAWRHYLLACVNFAQNQYKVATDHLNETKALNKDRVGWNLGVRTLAIMTAIEQEHFDHADSMIISMQQFIKQALKGEALRKRDEHILNLLIELRKNSYDFEAAVAKKTNLLPALKSENPDFCWYVQSPELIVFHTWFESKLLNQEYTPSYSKHKTF